MALEALFTILTVRDGDVAELGILVPELLDLLGLGLELEDLRWRGSGGLLVRADLWSLHDSFDIDVSVCTGARS